MLPIIVYSHSTHHDVLDVFADSAKKFELDKNFKCCLLSDDVHPSDIFKLKMLYFPMDSYAGRLRTGCKNMLKLDEEYFMLLHEDFILYDKPNVKAIYALLDEFKQNKDIDFIRLIRSNDKALNQYKPNLYISQNNLCIQATIFKTNSLDTYLMEVKDYSIYDIEVMQNSDLEGLFYFEGTEKLVGTAHYESLIFPYTATAVCKGKWNKEYYEELKGLGVDFSKRGLV